MLEPCAVKVARTVLRGVGAGNSPRLPGGSEKDIDMPRSINGTGRMWYGNALIGPDGSYVVTEWVTIFFIPLIPLGSKRILRDVNHENNFKPWYKKEWNTEYFKTSKVPLHMPHVLKGYAITLIVTGLFSLVDYLKI
jgi:hypothetical protein